MNNDFRLDEVIEVIEEILSSGGEFKFQPKGVSMRPLIVGGRDSVVLKSFDPNTVKKHDMLFYRRENGQFVLHRLIKIENDGRFTMCGDNQLKLERRLDSSFVIGVVSGLYRKGKSYDLSGVSYRLYKTFWCFMPLRHILLFPRRCFRSLKRILIKRKKTVD